jgi:hypothetical protein
MKIKKGEGGPAARIDTRIVRRLSQGVRVLLGKPLKRGDKITIVATDFDGIIHSAIRGRVIHAHRGRVLARSVGLKHGRETGVLYRRHEGRTWARGWDTPEAVVLSAEIALLVSK